MVVPRIIDFIPDAQTLLIVVDGVVLLTPAAIIA